MNLSYVVYRTSSYKTTNPPISTSSELSLCANGIFGRKLKKTVEYNSDKTVNEYDVSDEQYAELLRLFEELKIKESAFEIMSREPLPEMPQMVGGSESSSFDFTLNGVTVSVNKPTENMLSFVRALGDIITKAENPTWICNSCGQSNSSNFCSNCGQPKN